MNKCFILCAGLSDPFPDLVCPPVNGSGNVCVPMNLRKGTWDSFHHLCLVLKNNCSFVAINIQPWNIFQRILCQFSSIQLLSHVRLFETPWTAACQAFLSISNSRSLLKLMPIESVMPSNHLILSCPLLLLPSNLPSIRVSSNESVLRIRWPTYWVSASASVLPVNIQDWFPLGWTGWISLKSKGLTRIFSNTTIQKHQFSGTQLSL